MESTLKRTWAEIDLDALAHNYGRLRQHIGPKVRFLGVVKADAYGHGAVQVARTLQELGADYLAVSSIDEAMELRANGVTMPVLILGHTPKEQVGRLMEHHITQAVTCKAKALEYSREAAALGGTLVVLMGAKNWDSIRRQLIEGGRSPDTPVAAIRWGTTDRQEAQFGTLGTLVAAQLKAPVTIVLGEVARADRPMALAPWFASIGLGGR